MYLKRLDVVGFKSFAERIGVDFVPGVTAVVGPNGSGKSNITDAIRWVLGEQSAKSLRGAKMEDIIFAGSDSRKALNFAEVTLTLDNEDQALPIEYNEVSVTRRVYRSGDSEFLINKQPCRLKDIVDLFMDSGLGREAFSIISQGKVEEILNSKPEERRTIFEEAAGVLKYKQRKKKAESKLTETQDNLNRVSDILHELEGQVEPLQIQASIAKDYLEQKEQLEKIEVAVTVNEIEELQKSWEQLSARCADHKEDELGLSSSLQAKEAKIEETRDHIQALDESINHLQDVLLRVSEELEKLEGRKEVLKERKKNASQNKEQLVKNLEEMELRKQELTQLHVEQENSFTTINDEVKRLQQLLRSKQEELKLYNEDVEAAIDSLKSDYIELLNEQATNRNELVHTEKQLAQQGVRNVRLENENEKYLRDREEIASKKASMVEELETIQANLKLQLQRFSTEQQKLDQLRNKYEKQEAQLYQAYQILQKAKSRKDMLEEMEDDYSGFFQGVKEVLKARGTTLNGIKGAIAEVITVPKKYGLAIETALGGATQHIVVDNEENGRRAISYLKQHSYGRATFLPISVIKPKSLSGSQLQLLRAHSSFVGIASELIGYEEHYKDVIANLLGTVVVTKDLKGANELAKLLQYRCRFVTIDGDIVNPGGSMTGGAVKANQTSLLSRKGELEELKTHLISMEKSTDELEQKVKELKKEVLYNQTLLEEVRKSGEELRLEEQTKKGYLREIELEEKTNNEKLKIYDVDMSQFNEDQAQLTERKTNLETLLDKIEQDLARINNQIADLSEKKSTLNSSKETVLEEIGDLKVSLAAAQEQRHFIIEKLDATKKNLFELDQRKQEFEEDLNLLSNEMTSSHSGEQFLETEAMKKQIDKKDTLEMITTRREERLKLHSELEDAELEVKELKRQHKGLISAITDEEVKLGRLDVELENRLTHLREEYLLSYEAAKESFSLEFPVEEARKKLKLIKLAIDELGVVNLGAIEEYERVSERYEFLVEQKTDLQEAKDTLFLVIDEMDEEMKRRFEHTFTGIKSHFEFVFQALFGGGRADLKLTNPDDLLNTGVEIVAQPPGKKLQNLGLLSGGERSLTAIALLFSILKVRPVPFCILDEVEAALDEANVQRFSQYLKRYSEETQFIVITHRKGTMEEADVLYGVTMQESGVSKLVSVRLEESRELVQL